MPMSAEESEVREANARFYRALNDLDLSGMDRVWAHESFVRCVHPGWELIVGWEAVRASWEGIFRRERRGAGPFRRDRRRFHSRRHRTSAG